MAEQNQAGSLNTPREDPIFDLERHVRNPVGYPVGPITLTTLIVHATAESEREHRYHWEQECCAAVRAAINTAVGRLPWSNRFRLHSALHAYVGYVPTWLAEPGA